MGTKINVELLIELAPMVSVGVFFFTGVSEYRLIIDEIARSVVEVSWLVSRFNKNA